MRVKHLFSVLVLVAAAELFILGVASETNESSHSMRGYTSKQSLGAAGVTSVNFSSTIVSAEEDGSAINASSSGSSSSSVTFPVSTNKAEKNSDQFTTTQASPEPPTAAPSTTTPSTTRPGVAIQSESASSSTSTSSSSSSEASAEMRNNSVTAEADNYEASVAQPGMDSSTFQSVTSVECSENEVDNVYELYSNCRSAFDLCVYASDYQIFPYQGEHPTQAQIQGMAESDACIAVFIVVIEANFSACTIGGMPLVSAVETLLKISVDLEEGVENSAPSANEFQELLAWRYEVDLAKAAGVPYDGSSELYAQFETNLDAALENTTVRVNEDLTVDVRLTNGSYETFEDAIDQIVTDASAIDLMPGYVVASSEAESSSSSSQDTTGIVIESSVGVASCSQNLWSLVVVVVASAFMLVEGTRRRV